MHFKKEINGVKYNHKHLFYVFVAIFIKNKCFYIIMIKFNLFFLNILLNT